MINKDFLKEKLNAFYYPPKDGVALPAIIMIEPTNACNLKCSMCYVQQHIKTRHFLSFTDYQKIINQFPKIKELIFCGIGEPLLSKDLFYMINDAKERGISFINLVTNGKLLSEGISEMIVSSKINRIQISVHSFNAAIFSKIRNEDAANLEKIKNNIKRLAAIKKKLKSSLKICCNAVVNQLNYNELLEFVKGARDLGVDRVEFIQMTTANDNLRSLNAPLICMPKVARQVRKMASRIDIELGFLNGNEYGRCYQLWDFIMVHADGNISPCNGIFPTENIGLGNILREPIERIWESKKYQRLRQSVVAGKLQNCKYCESGYRLEGVNLTWIKNYYFRPFKRILKKLLNSKFRL